MPRKKTQQQPLGVAFGKGWSSLPNELKVGIVSYNLTYDSDLFSWDFNRGRRSVRRPRGRLSEGARYVEEFVSLCLSFPADAGLITDVFYTVNTFRLAISWFYSFQYPKPSVNQFLRRAKIRSDGKMRDWEIMGKLARGTYGLSKMQTLEIQFYIYIDLSNQEEWAGHLRKLDSSIQTAGSLSFPVKNLRLTFEFRYWYMRPQLVTLGKNVGDLVVGNLQIRDMDVEKTVINPWLSDGSDGWAMSKVCYT